MGVYEPDDGYPARFATRGAKKYVVQHPDGKIEVVGEAVTNAKRGVLGEMSLGGVSAKVTVPGVCNPILYRKAGYVSVGNGTYVVLLKSRLPFLIPAAAMIVAAAVTIGLLLGLNPAPVDPVNPLPDIDTGAVKETIDDGKPPVLEEEQGGNVNLEYRATAKLDATTGKISMYFRNPTNSTHDMVITLYLLTTDADGGEVAYEIAKSGRIEPGYKVEEMLFEETVNFVNNGRYEAKYIVGFYNPTTGVLENVQTAVDDVTLTVEGIGGASETN